MPHWRKSSVQSASRFNAYLAGWAFALSVVLTTLLLLLRHGVI
jgi:hypothetical protein